MKLRRRIFTVVSYVMMVVGAAMLYNVTATADVNSDMPFVLIVINAVIGIAALLVGFQLHTLLKGGK